ncbi:MAG TPA: multicopper oxidase domain-containing protein [Actinomycetota bacterium]|nr:multicopper oxidase domain-containing protein [Actinomycetota bacterium]
MTSVSWGRRARALLLACAVLASIVSTRSAITRIDAPETCIEPNKRVTMYADELPRTPEGKARVGYGLQRGKPTIPGPTIELIEGDCLGITLVNDVSRETLAEIRDDPILGNRDPNHPLGVSLHVHGVKYTTGSDGTLHSGSWVPPGEVRTYIWHAAPRATVAQRVASLGTAGYWWYHDHVVGTSHGTGGSASGLFGALVVRRPGDLEPDRQYVVGMGPNATLNLRKDPDCESHINPVPSNTCYVARQGERVEFIVIGFGDDFHTFHLHGHTWTDNRTGIPTSEADDTRLIDAKTIGPSETFGFQIIAGEEVGTGMWMLHCHVQTHSDNGMSTFLHVLPASVQLPSAPALPDVPGEAAAPLPSAEHVHR